MARKKAPLLALGLSLMTGWAGAGEIDEIKAQIKALQERLDRMEAAGKEVPRAPAAAAGGTVFSLDGYVQLDAIHDMRGNQGPEVNMAALPLDGSSEAARKNTTSFSVRTSRLNFQTATPVAGATVRTRIEFDFFTTEGSATSNRPRLRHTYGQLGNWLVGQTWSTFMDLNTLLDLAEFAGPTGQSFVRQPMVRYTLPVGTGNTLALAVESPRSELRDAGGTATAIDRGPDVIANWTFTREWGHFALRGLVRAMRADNGRGDDQASAVGWAGGFAGSFKLGAFDTFIYLLNAGKGAGRYIMGTNPATYEPGSRLHAQRAVGGYVGLQHGWSDIARSTIVWSATEDDNQPGIAPLDGLNRRTRELHANVIWSPYRHVDVGVEYIAGYRKVENGQKGYLRRLQSFARFGF